MPLEKELKVYQFLGQYGNGLLNGIDAGHAYRLTCDGGQNPAWLLGHLAFVAGRVTTMFGGESPVDLEYYGKLYGIGSKPNPDQADQPDFDQIIEAWRDGHDAVVKSSNQVTDELLAQPNTNERMKDVLPTQGDFLSFVLTGHEAMHLGQLSVWRRVQGFAPLF
jgi:hypothetical protein